MTNQEILTKAIEKAIDGGMSISVNFYMFDGGKIDYEECLRHYQEIIFNHNFAKALWGEVPNTGYLKAVNLIPWKYYLQQMVIADDPIKYLGENI